MSKTEYSFDGLSSWEKQIGETISAKYPNAFRQMVVQLAYELQGSCKELTPVDTSRLKDGWQVGRIVKKGKVYYIEVYNKVEYAESVNYGHRVGKTGYKEGVYMLEISLEKLNKRLPPYLKRWIDNFIKTHNL